MRLHPAAILLITAAAAAASPFAVEVVDYAPGAVPTGDFDWITGDLFTNAATALGPPTADTTDDDGEDAWAVVPVRGAWRAHEVVTIGPGGSLTLRFDQPVEDDANNLYGIDLIVFGNTFQQLGSDRFWTNGNPTAETVQSTSINAEGGTVSVSQDGTNWHAFASGTADAFAPTLGRVFDTNHPAAALGPSNRWWGEPADPTRPLDPALEPTDFEGWTVAELARRYRGSAGGAGFDLAELPLPATSTNGAKWIRYVRIANPPESVTAPEIDAVADAAPASAYDRWVADTFPWSGDPALEAPRADGDGSGFSNAERFLFGAEGRPPDPMLEVDPRLGRVTYRVHARAAGIPVLVEASDALWDPLVDWTTNGIGGPVEGAVEPDGGTPISREIPGGRTNAYFRLRVLWED
jgi:hypothetical protein